MTDGDLDSHKWCGWFVYNTSQRGDGKIKTTFHCRRLSRICVVFDVYPLSFAILAARFPLPNVMSNNEDFDCNPSRGHSSLIWDFKERF